MLEEVEGQEAEEEDSVVQEEEAEVDPSHKVGTTHPITQISPTEVVTKVEVEVEAGLVLLGVGPTLVEVIQEVHLGAEADSLWTGSGPIRANLFATIVGKQGMFGEIVLLGKCTM